MAKEREKKAFFATTPFKVKDEKELKSAKGYLKEQFNRTLGQTAGATTGFVGGGALGYGLMPRSEFANSKRSKEELKSVKQVLKASGMNKEKIKRAIKILKHIDPAKAGAAIFGGVVGGSIGSIVGDVRSLRKTERKAGVEDTGVGQYIGRGVGAGLAGSAALAAGLGLKGQMLGGRLGDALISRKLIGYEKGPKVETNG